MNSGNRWNPVPIGTFKALEWAKIIASEITNRSAAEHWEWKRQEVLITASLVKAMAQEAEFLTSGVLSGRHLKERSNELLRQAEKFLMDECECDT